MYKLNINNRDSMCLISVASIKKTFIILKTSLLSYEDCFAKFSFKGEIFEGTILSTGNY